MGIESQYLGEINIPEEHRAEYAQQALKLLREQVFTMLHEGKIKPHIFRTFSQAEIQEAHQVLDSGAFTGSLVLKF